MTSNLSRPRAITAVSIWFISLQILTHKVPGKCLQFSLQSINSYFMCLFYIRLPVSGLSAVFNAHPRQSQLTGRVGAERRRPSPGSGGPALIRLKIVAGNVASLDFRATNHKNLYPNDPFIRLSSDDFDYLHIHVHIALKGPNELELAIPRIRIASCQ